MNNHGKYCDSTIDNNVIIHILLTKQEFIFSKHKKIKPQNSWLFESSEALLFHMNTMWSKSKVKINN